MSSPSSENETASRAEAVFAAWAVRVEGGETLDFDELVRSHAALASELARLHEDWRLFAPILGRAVPGLIADASGVVLPSLARDPDSLEIEPPSDELYERLGIHVPSEGRYRFRSVIGRGGGGVVIKVWDSKLNRPLAMKIVLGRGEKQPSGETPKVDGRTLSRFVDEARIASQLNHPGIVPVHELGADEAGRAFFTMKLVKGDDLARIFAKVASGEDGWNPARALGVLQRVCEAMAYAHDRGVIHRDLKPANVMVGAYGEVHVMDWGLARVLGEKDPRDLRISPSGAPISAVDSFRKGAREESPDSPLVTMDGAVIGTPSYMSPEQARGELDEVGTRSDVYAVGAMLYHLIGGEPPYVPKGGRLPQAVVLTNLMHGPPRSVLELAPRASSELVAICEKAMQRESTRRYGSMLELASDLRAFLEGRVVSAYETGTWAETKKWVIRNKALAASIVATVVIAVVGVAAFATQSAEATRRADEATAEKKRADANALRAEDKARVAQAATERAEWQGYVAAVTGADAARRANESATVRRLLESAPKGPRGWEWCYLAAVTDTSVFVIEGQDARFSPDGTRLVTTSVDAVASIWDASTGMELVTLDSDTSGAHAYRFSPDGSCVVTSYGRTSARVWDAVTGRPLATLDGHTSWVTSADFSADGMRIVTASIDTTVRVWDARNGRELAKLDGHSRPFASAQLSPDGTSVVTTTSGDVARVWDSTSGRELFELRGHDVGVQGAKFSPDGTRILAMSSYGASIWDAKSGEELKRIDAKSGAFDCNSAEFSFDGTRVVTTSSDGQGLMWDASRGTPLTRYKFAGHTSWLSSAHFSLDGTYIVTASGDNTARVWEAASGAAYAKLEGHTQPVRSAEFSRDGARVITTSDDGTSRVWLWASVDEVRLARFEAHAGEMLCANFTADSTRVVTAAGHHGTSIGENTARVWDAASGRQLARLEGHTSSVNSANGSPDGARIVTASKDKTARVWNAATGNELLKLAGHAGAVNDANFSRDGARIVTASEDQTVRVWDAASGRELAKLDGSPSAVNSANFSFDGARIVSAYRDRSVRIWDVATTRVLSKFEDYSDGLGGVSFSPDGTRIISPPNDETVHILDAASGERLVALEGHTGAVVGTNFSPDGTRVVTASLDKTARVWDAMSGRELIKLDWHWGSVLSASFSADATRIITTSYDGNVRIWDSVPCRARIAERRAIEGVRLQAERVLTDAISVTNDWSSAAAQLRSDASLDPLVRRAALDSLMVRANTSLLALAPKRAECTWISRMLGRESWPEVSRDLTGELTADLGAGAFASEALRIVDLYEPDYGGETRALALVRRAVELNAASSHREILACALFRVGRFDEALAEQRKALADASDDEKSSLQIGLSQLESSVAAWRDEQGNLRVTEWTARLETLKREIAAIEQEPDVKLWLAGPR